MMAARQSARAIALYEHAESHVLSAGYGWELDWQRRRLSEGFTEQDLLREAAWVVLCSGFRESYVRSVFDYISLCFCDWESAKEISLNKLVCIESAKPQFRNQRKLNAIVAIADKIYNIGFDRISTELYSDPIENLQMFPFIGPVTSWHLAKNLGFNVAKNDRHLARLAIANGYSDAHSLCGAISSATGELTGIIDVVLWRYAVISQRPALRDPRFL